MLKGEVDARRNRLIGAMILSVLLLVGVWLVVSKLAHQGVPPEIESFATLISAAGPNETASGGRSIKALELCFSPQTIAWCSERVRQAAQRESWAGEGSRYTVAAYVVLAEANVLFVDPWGRMRGAAGDLAMCTSLAKAGRRIVLLMEEAKAQEVLRKHMEFALGLMESTDRL